MANKLISDFLNAMPVPALLVDLDERIIGANNDVQDVLGQNIEGRHFATILRQPQTIEAIETCALDRSAQKSRHLGHDGAQDTTYLVDCRFVRGIGSRAAGAVLVSFSDVTDIEKTGQMRRDFVTNVSHELRTPLTALMGFIETLQGPARDDPEARDRFLWIMASEATRMNRLVGDLLSLNRVESEERVRPDQIIDLTAQMQSTCRSLQPVADARGTSLVLDVPEDAVHIGADEDQLRQVMTNLIENAIKYGRDDGSVHINLETRDKDPLLRVASVRITVADDGPGIAPEHLPRLTERFYRADNHRSRQLGGTGLGLAIVKHIINRHRGRMRVKSTLEEGTCFTVILPQKQVRGRTNMANG
ncbi:MAG: sensor histidine kinase [Paracoccaceae bacterium]